MEYNSIASSFGTLSNKVHHMHEYVRRKYGADLNFNYDKPENDYWSFIKSDPDLKSLHYHQGDHHYSTKLAESFKHALQLYCRSVQHTGDPRDIWVLFVCEDDERNLCDQKAIENDLLTKFGIKSMRKTLDEISKEFTLDQRTKVLQVGGKEIGLVYYRTCY